MSVIEVCLFTVVNIEVKESFLSAFPQEPPALTEDDNGSDNSQFTGSTINLQDLE